MKKNFSEKEIDLIDMFWSTCLKWRSILLWAIIFAVFAGGFSYLKSAKAAKIATEPVEEIALEDIKLEEDSLENVNSYLEHKQIFEDQVKYNSQAFLMQLDANGFYRQVLTYYIDNHYLVEYPVMSKSNNINAMVEAYRAELRAEEFTIKLEEVTQCDEAKVSYKKELVDFSNRFGEETKSNDDDGILMISIYSVDKQECEVLAELVKETILNGKSRVTEKVGAHDISLIEDSCDYVADADLLKYQQENIGKLSTYANIIDSMKGKLTETELAYIDAYEKEKETAEQGESIEQEVVITDATINIKLVIVGFIGGMTSAFCVIMLLYLFNCRLRLEDNFEKVYNVKLLGNVIVKDEKKKRWFCFIDDFLNKMRHLNKHYFTEEDAVSMVAAGIKIGAKKQGTSKIYVTGATLGKEEKTLIEKIKRELCKNNIEVISGKPILYDAEALEMSAEIGYVVLFEHAGVSLYSEIAEEIEICEHQGVRILGAIVLA